METTVARTASHSPAAPATRWLAEPKGTSARRGRECTREARRAHPVLRTLRNLALLALVGALLVSAFFVARGYNLYREALAAESPAAMAASIREEPGYTPIDELPSFYLQAVVSAEDRRFYAHPGFDIIATGRALVNDLRAGTVVEGGSTITQQLAKNEYFTQDQTIERKVAEVFMAFTLESEFSKQEILELYVNSIFFGNGYTGIGAASEGYFGKAPRDLTESESALLAGVPNAPTAYAPTSHPDLAQQRRAQVLNRMEEQGAITPEKASHVAAQPLDLAA